MKSLYYPKNIIKSIFLLILFFFSAYFAIAQQCTTKAPDKSIICGTSAAVKLDTSSPTSYEPQPNLSPAPVDMSVIGIDVIPLLINPDGQQALDDDLTSPISIGFPFIFYGNTYNDAIIQTNGIVGFGPAFTYEGYQPMNIPVPSPLPPNNYVAGMYADIDLGRGGTLKYARTGTAPNRQFVVEFRNVRPYTGTAPGTASFQIILNENGTFDVTILQLSAGWLSTTSGALMTCGAENIDGTIANTVPGRNRTDWITNGVDITSPNSWIFSAVTCTFINWTNPLNGTILSTNTNYTVSPKPLVTTSYRASWQCGAKICEKDATVTVTPPTLKDILVTNNTNCTATGNGSIDFTTNLPDGIYTLDYLLDGVPKSSSVTVASGVATSLTGLEAGTYTGFSLPSFTPPTGCNVDLPTTITITKTLAVPTTDTVPAINCPNTTLILTNSETSVVGTTINWYSAPNGGGTLLGTGTTLSVAPKVTTTYYVRRESVTCGVSADKVIVVNVRAFVYAANAASATTYCVDKDGWNHFYNASNQIIFSVKGNLGAGVPQATISLNASSYQSPNATPNCAAPADEKFEMARSWDFSLGAGVPTGTYDVRFYYTNAERQAVETAATNWISANPSCNYGYKYLNAGTPDFANSGFFWFKNVAGNYSAPTYDALHLAGTTSSTETGGTANYAEITGITSFSGGSGGVILTPIVPLPVTLLSFSGKRINSNQIKLTWETVAEINNAGFEIEFATNARDFEKIAFQPAQGNSKTVATYQQNINNTIGGYFRLKQIDKDKKYNYSKIIYIEGTNDAVIRIYPNPTKDNLTIDLGEFKATDEVKATFRNVLGVQVTELSLTKTQTEISLGNLPKGIYMVQVVKNGKMIVEKIVLQ